MKKIYKLSKNIYNINGTEIARLAPSRFKGYGMGVQALAGQLDELLEALNGITVSKSLGEENIVSSKPEEIILNKIKKSLELRFTPKQSGATNDFLNDVGAIIKETLTTKFLRDTYFCREDSEEVENIINNLINSEI